MTQTTQTQRLARRIRKLRDGKNGKKLPWRLVCIEAGIYLPSGEPDTGLAYQIAYNDKEPASREIRGRIGLSDICTGCKRPYRKHGPGTQDKTAARCWWDKLSPQARAELIEIVYDVEVNKT